MQSMEYTIEGCVMIRQLSRDGAVNEFYVLFLLCHHGQMSVFLCITSCPYYLSHRSSAKSMAVVWLIGSRPITHEFASKKHSLKKSHTHVDSYIQSQVMNLTYK